jgi:hypothetical protein
MLRVAEPDPFAEAEPTRFPRLDRAGQPREVDFGGELASQFRVGTEPLDPGGRDGGIGGGFAMPAGEEIGESGVKRIGSTGVG